MADVRLAHHRNKQAPRPGQGGTSRNPPPHETPPADRQDRSAASSDRRHRKTLADLAWNRLRFVQNDGIRNEPNWRVVRSVQLSSHRTTLTHSRIGAAARVSPAISRRICPLRRTISPSKTAKSSLWNTRLVMKPNTALTKFGLYGSTMNSVCTI